MNTTMSATNTTLLVTMRIILGYKYRLNFEI